MDLIVFDGCNKGIINSKDQLHEEITRKVRGYVSNLNCPSVLLSRTDFPMIRSNNEELNRYLNNLLDNGHDRSNPDSRTLEDLQSLRKKYAANQYMWAFETRKSNFKTLSTSQAFMANQDISFLVIDSTKYKHLDNIENCDIYLQKDKQVRQEAIKAALLVDTSIREWNLPDLKFQLTQDNLNQVVEKIYSTGYFN